MFSLQGAVPQPAVDALPVPADPDVELGQDGPVAVELSVHDGSSHRHLEDGKACQQGSALTCSLLADTEQC